MKPFTLTSEQLAGITGARRKDLQIAWLQDRGWVYELTRGGEPVVLTAYAEKKLGLVMDNKRRKAPDFAQVSNA